MPTFDYTFTVNASQNVVRSFHHDTGILKILTPPLLFMQIHFFEPLANGSEAEFTMWFGPIPARWHVIHSDVSQHGFTDSQTAGPLKFWQHTHTFRAIDEQKTQVQEHIEFEHPAGLKGLFTRLIFNRPGLTLLFTYRQFITKRKTESRD